MAAPSEKLQLSPSQKARIERNREKALQLKKARLASRPYPEKKPDSEVKKVKGPKRVIDTGAGFLIDEEDEEEVKTLTQEPKVVHAPGPILGPDTLNCEECSKEFLDSYLNSTFDALVCDSCRDNEGKHKLITKTDAKNKYLLKDCDFDMREPALKFILKKNPHNPRWGEMKLFLTSQVEKRAMDVWGSQEKIDEALEEKEENRQMAKQRRYDKKVKDLRNAVRSSLWTKDISVHEHEFGEETYDEDEDEYSKTCKTCGHTMTYEKM